MRARCGPLPTQWGQAGAWRAAHRVKAPVGMEGEQFGHSMTAGATAAGAFVVGVGAYHGCWGYVVALPEA